MNTPAAIRPPPFVITKKPPSVAAPGPVVAPGPAAPVVSPPRGATVVTQQPVTPQVVVPETTRPQAPPAPVIVTRPAPPTPPTLSVIPTIDVPRRDHGPCTNLPYLHAPKGKYARSALMEGDAAMISLARTLDVERDGLISALHEAHNNYLTECMRGDTIEKMYRDVLHQCQNRIVSLEAQAHVFASSSGGPAKKDVDLISALRGLEEENNVLALRVVEAERAMQREQANYADMVKRLDNYVNR